MNNQEKYEEDLLKKYINPEGIEMAPKGFTSKVMASIQLESVYGKAARHSMKKSLVPVISVAVIVLLLAVAILVPGNKTDLLTPEILKILNNLKSLLPEPGISSIFRLTLPSVMMYVFIGILILTVFDRALSGIFHREDKTNTKN